MSKLEELLGLAREMAGNGKRKVDAAVAIEPLEASIHAAKVCLDEAGKVLAERPSVPEGSAPNPREEGERADRVREVLREKKKIEEELRHLNTKLTKAEDRQLDVSRAVDFLRRFKLTCPDLF